MCLATEEVFCLDAASCRHLLFALKQQRDRIEFIRGSIEIKTGVNRWSFVRTILTYCTHERGELQQSYLTLQYTRK